MCKRNRCDLVLNDLNITSFLLFYNVFLDKLSGFFGEEVEVMVNRET